MAKAHTSQPFSVLDPLARAWDEMVHKNRRLQAKNDPPAAGRSDARRAPSTSLADGVSDA